MAVPVTDRSALAQEVFALLAILPQLGDATIALLAELVPERGEALWVRFRGWQKQAPADSGFHEWISALVKENMTTVMYPYGCTLDKGVRMMLLSEVIGASGALNNAQLLNIHFAVEPQYGKARAVSCRGCPMTKCEHYLR